MEKITAALTKFNYTEPSNEELAMHIGFTENELEMMKIFWDPCFNKSWFYLYPDFITKKLGYDTPKHFYSDVLRKKYVEHKDYQKVNKSHNLIQEFYSRNFDHRKQPGNKALYYLITGKCLKLILMRANTKLAMETHEYYIKVEELAICMKDYIQSMHKYLYEKQLEESKKQLEDREQQIEESKKQIEESNKKIKQLEIQTFNMKTFVDTVKQREKMEYIYIATTEKYAMKNHFKIGKAGSLQKRLPGYQTGRPNEDLYFYVWTFKCHSSIHIENRIKHLLMDWKPDIKKEIYVIHFEALLNIVQFICKNYDNEINKLNEFIVNITSLYYNKEPILLKRSDYVNENVTLPIEENKTKEKIEIVDITKLTDEELTKCVIMALNESIRVTTENKDFDFNQHKNDDLNLIIDWGNFKNTTMTMFKLNKSQLKIKTVLKPKIKELEQEKCFKKVKWR